MAVKKDQKEKKIIKSTTIQKAKPQKKTEQKFFAQDLANKMGIDSFEFLLIKREAGLEDNSIISMYEMKKLYNKIAKR